MVGYACFSAVRMRITTCSYLVYAFNLWVYCATLAAKPEFGGSPGSVGSTYAIPGPAGMASRAATAATPLSAATASIAGIASCRIPFCSRNSVMENMMKE